MVYKRPLINTSPSSPVRNAAGSHPTQMPYGLQCHADCLRFSSCYSGPKRIGLGKEKDLLVYGGGGGIQSRLVSLLFLSLHTSLSPCYPSSAKPRKTHRADVWGGEPLASPTEG